MQIFASHIAHIETAISKAPEWKTEDLHFYVTRYCESVARGHAEYDAWTLYGVYIARLLGFSEHSRMPRPLFVKAVAEALDARVAGLTALAEITGVAPWALAMVYVLGA